MPQNTTTPHSAAVKAVMPVVLKRRNQLQLLGLKYHNLDLKILMIVSNEGGLRYS